MKKIALALAALAAGAFAGDSDAAIRQMNFTAGPMEASFTTPTAPFGVDTGDFISGYFQFDDSTITGAGTYDLTSIITGLSFSTGSRSWLMSEIIDNSSDTVTFDSSGQVTMFGFYVGVTSADYAYVFSNNTAGVRESAGASSNFTACNGCVNYAEGPVNAVPLPAGLPLLLGGLFVLGAAGWTARRQEA